MGLGVSVVNLHWLHGDGEHPSFAHRVPGIHGQVHYDLLDHAGVGLNERGLNRRLKLQRHGFTEQPLEHFGHVPNDFAQIERLWLDQVFAAEHQQLARQSGRPLGGEINRLGGLQQLARQSGPRHQEARMPLDDRQHVIEIVGDPGRQLPHRLHLLRLAQLGLEVQTVGDVFDVAMNDLAGHHGMQRPGKRAARYLRFEVAGALACSQAVCDDFGDVRRKDLARMVTTGRNRQLERGVVEISDRSVGGQFHRRVGIELGEGGQLLQLGLRQVPLHRHRQHRGNGQQEMDFVFGKFSCMGGVCAQNPIGLAVTGDGDRHPADYSVLDQHWRSSEARFLRQVLHHHRFAGGERKPRLRSRISRHDHVSNRAFLPADACSQHHRAAIGQQFQNVAILHFEGLGDQHNHLVKQRRKIVADHGELAQGADDRLLEGAVEQRFLGLFAFQGALAQRFGHGVEGPPQLADFAGFVSQAGAAAEVSFAPALGGFGQYPNLAQDKPLAAEPGGPQRQQADGETRPRKARPVQQRQRGGDGHQDGSHQSKAQAGETGHRQLKRSFPRKDNGHERTGKDKCAGVRGVRA